ncbi:GDSL-type esterase/lipase family protein, partial [Mycobacterium sp. NAZ190054]|uniref:GDSL-type esterase/lipase family protein n=1 Tax=Mycobacterium sp. NAZ190054 TaxID=1747766 RepID=UPI001E4A8892
MFGRAPLGHAPGRSAVALAAAATLASTAYVGARNLLSGQADQARRVIPKAWAIPPRADGVYSPGGGPVERWHRGVAFDLHLMIFGDSTATGYGCDTADEVPGVLLARGLAAASGKRIRLSTKAIVGATSKGLSGQIDAMYVAGPPPDAAVIMIGANDITRPNGIGPSARRLGAGQAQAAVAGHEPPGRGARGDDKIGRASCGERGDVPGGAGRREERRTTSR